jgi:hypothetical protein
MGLNCKQLVVEGALLYFDFFQGGILVNLTPKNDVVLYFSSNLMVLTNGGGQNTTVR